MILQDFNPEEHEAIGVLRARFWMRHPDRANAFERLVLVKGNPENTIASGLTEEAIPRQFILLSDSFFGLSVADQMKSVLFMMTEYEKSQSKSAEGQASDLADLDKVKPKRARKPCPNRGDHLL